MGHTSWEHHWCTGQREWEATTTHAPQSPSTSVPSIQIKQKKALGPNFPLTAALQDDEVILGAVSKKCNDPVACDWGALCRDAIFFATSLLMGCFQGVLVYSGWSLIISLSSVTGSVPFSHNICPQHCISPLCFLAFDEWNWQKGQIC